MYLLEYKYYPFPRNGVFVHNLIFLQTYPKSAKNLNFVTKQLDATMYGDGGGKLPIKNMVDPITMVIERMRSKNPDMVLIPGMILIGF